MRTDVLRHGVRDEDSNLDTVSGLTVEEMVEQILAIIQERKESPLTREDVRKARRLSRVNPRIYELAIHRLQERDIRVEVGWQPYLRGLDQQLRILNAAFRWVLVLAAVVIMAPLFMHLRSSGGFSLLFRALL